MKTKSDTVKKVTRFDREMLKTFDAGAIEALRSFAAERGLTVEEDGGKFYENESRGGPGPSTDSGDGPR
jgi:hypothetical protein